MNAGLFHPRQYGCRARVFLTLNLLILTLLATGCGQITTRSTVRVPTATGTQTPTSTSTPRPTATPAPYTPAPTATPTVTPTPIVHAIARGETLLAIANKYGVSVAAIQDANGIADPRLLQVGQQIFVPAPTVVVEAVAGASPTPVSTPMPVTVGPIHFGTDAAGGLWALGEVSNPGTEPLEGVMVVVSLLDSAGQELATGEALTQLDVLDRDGKSPFGVYFPSPPAAFARYIAQVSGALPAHIGSYYLDLVTNEVTGEGERYHAYTVRGTLSNVGPEDAVAVGVNVTLYDALGNVIGYARAAPEHNVIPRGGKTSFSVSVIPLGGPVASSVVTAQGRRAGTPTPSP